MKRVVGFLLSMLIMLSLLGGLSLSVFGTTEQLVVSESELIDFDIYKAQCLAGIAYDPNSDAVECCNALYNYYIYEELFSPTQTFLQEAYADKTLMMNFDEWKLSYLAEHYLLSPFA